MKHLKTRIRDISFALLPEITEIRRHLHRHPELSFEEHQTAAFISEYLTGLGIQHQTGVARTGIVGLIKGNKEGGQTVALRADMDALPISELNTVPYKSLHEGKMHACGHDVHMACLLGAAKILNDLRDHFGGQIKLIFQPSEENYPGGARVMIEEGALENPAPSVIIGQHVYPDLSAGEIGLRSGKSMASTDEIYLTVHGKGGHGATPDKNTDPVLIAAHILVALQQIVSRNAKPGNPTVLSFGRFIADGKTNIIPDSVRLEGIMRTFDEQWRSEMKEKITAMATQIASAMGAKCDVFIDPGYPVLINDDELTRRVINYATDFLGQEKVSEIDMRTTAEDFAYFAQKIPGCFYRLGVRHPGSAEMFNLHTATFDVDENSLAAGMGLMAWIAVNETSLKQ